MKFSENQQLFYVCPFIFKIDKITVSYAYRENDGVIYYIDQEGAYLKEQDLFEDLVSAKKDAINKLEKFYNIKLREIELSKG